MNLFEQDLPTSVDMHCHLSDCGGYRAAETGALLLAVTNEPATWVTMQRRAHQRNVTWALGLHPCNLSRDDQRLPLLLDAMNEASAIGEIGLDYSQRARCSPAGQRRILDQILSASSKRPRRHLAQPLRHKRHRRCSVHSRHSRCRTPLVSWIISRRRSCDCRRCLFLG